MRERRIRVTKQTDSYARGVALSCGCLDALVAPATSLLADQVAGPTRRSTGLLRRNCLWHHDEVL